MFAVLIGAIIIIANLTRISLFYFVFLKISYIGHDCMNIPDFLGDTYGQFARRLDLSFNLLR